MLKTKINCVVVTYNRLALLKENIEALQQQTYPIEKIVIVNNNSTDDTAEYLRQYEGNSLFHIVNMTENLGGAGGFNRGIREAVELGCDWVWVMDDDTIPTTTALENLVKYSDITPQVGYVASRVLWTDESIHIMNIPSVIAGYLRGKSYNSLMHKGALYIDAASFVSLLINADVVKLLGLPITEFFIWCDDMEYTSRIYNAGYDGIYADSSVAYHKTPFNYGPDILNADKSEAWKYYHEKKNRMYMLRQRKGSYFKFFTSMMSRFISDMKRIRKRKSGRRTFAKAYISAYWCALTFNPKIEYIDKK